MQFQVLLVVTLCIIAPPILAKKECKMTEWDAVTSLVAEKMFHKMKMMSEIHPKNMCLNVSIPKEELAIMQTCLGKSAAPVMVRMVRNKDYMFTAEDMRTFLHKSSECCMKKKGIWNDGTFEKSAYITESEKMIELVGQNEQTKNLAKEALKKCTDTELSEGSNTVDKAVSTHICMEKTIVKECEEMGKNPGFMKITNTLMSAIDTPRCAAKIDEKYLTGYFKECLAEANTVWGQPTADKRRTRILKFLKRDNRFHIKAVVEYIKLYSKVIIQPTMECVMEKMNVFNRTSLEVYKDNAYDLVQGFSWEIEAERDEVLSLVTECSSKGDEYLEDMDQFDVTDEQERKMAMMSVLKWRIRHEKCFLSRFMDLCGLNNDISKMFYPVTNPKFIEIIVLDFIEKRESRTFKKLISIFRQDIRRLLSHLKPSEKE